MDSNFPDMAMGLLKSVLMQDNISMFFWLALGIVVLFAAFGMKFTLNVMNAGFPSFFGALIAATLGGASMLGGATAANIYLSDMIPGDNGTLIAMVIGALLGLLIIGAPLAAFLCRSKYMAAIGSWFVGGIVAFVALLIFNTTVSGVLAGGKAAEKASDRTEVIEGAVNE